MPAPNSRPTAESMYPGIPGKICPLCGNSEVDFTEVDYTEFRCSACGSVWNEARQILNVTHLAELLGCEKSSLDHGFEMRFPTIPVKVLSQTSHGVTVAIGRALFAFEFPFSDYYIEEVIDDLWIEQVRRWRDPAAARQRFM